MNNNTNGPADEDALDAERSERQKTEAHLAFRIDELQSQMMALQNKLGEAHANNLSNAPASAPVSPQPPLQTQSAARGSHMSSLESADLEDEEEATGIMNIIEHVKGKYEYRRNMWDLMIIIGFPDMGLLGSLYVAMLAIGNMALQIIFVLLALQNFTIPEFDKEVEEGVRHWRLTTAHSFTNMDTTRGQSLMQRVCQRDPALPISNAHLNMNDRMDLYMPSLNDGNNIIFDGRVMSMLAVTCYYLAIVRELHAVWDQQKAALSIRRGYHTKVSRRGRIQQLSLGRLIMLQLTAVVRLGLVGALFYAGTQFLVNDIRVDDLLLNAVALEFILNIDELIFEALAPEPSVKILENLQPITTTRLATIRGLELKAFALSVVLVVGVIAVRLTLLEEVVDKIRATHWEMCRFPGQNFVYHTNLDGFLAIANTEINYTATRLNVSTLITAMQLAVVGDLVQWGADEYGYGQVETLDYMPTWGTMSFIGMVNHIDTLGHACEDHWFEDESVRLQEHQNLGIFKQVQWILEEYAVRSGQQWNSCNDLVEMCTVRETFPATRLHDITQLARFLCPVSCGCTLYGAYPFLPTVDQGCPASCDWAPEDLVGRENCADYTPQQLLQEPLWRKLMETAIETELLNVSVQIIEAQGCNILDVANITEEHRRDICFARDSFGADLRLKPLHAFCPVTCRCSAKRLLQRQPFDWHNYMDHVELAKELYDANEACPDSCYYEQACETYTDIIDHFCEPQNGPTDTTFVLEDGPDFDRPFVDDSLADSRFNSWRDKCIKIGDSESWGHDGFSDSETRAADQMMVRCYDCSIGGQENEDALLEFCDFTTSPEPGYDYTWVWNYTNIDVAQTRSFASTWWVHWQICEKRMWYGINPQTAEVPSEAQAEADAYRIALEDHCQDDACHNDELDLERICAGCEVQGLELPDGCITTTP
mmetsp:Transcript_30157/g.70369  ORF Transcript_30157/g.70369 Transcript_30157/m.70369 type:complete len:936 (-) Transcript_30157:207-3014(-)